MSLEDRIAQAWAESDEELPDVTISRFEAMRDEASNDARRTFELAGAYDWAGREHEAIPLYLAALDMGLEPYEDRCARVQYASSLRNVGRAADAVRVLRDAQERYPESSAVNMFLALALVDTGEGRAATSLLLSHIVSGAGLGDADEYRRALSYYAAELA